MIINRKVGRGFVGITAVAVMFIGAILCSCHNTSGTNTVSAITLTPLDQPTLDSIKALDEKNHDVTFVLVNNLPDAGAMHNRVITLPPIGNNLRIDMDKYVHKGHNGPLYIILPDNYAGPKEKLILKSFPAYKGWYGSMLSANFVMYAAK